MLLYVVFSTAHFVFQVTLYHLLKLFQSETDIMLGKKSLVVECYDEMIFQVCIGDTNEFCRAETCL